MILEIISLLYSFYRRLAKHIETSFLLYLLLHLCITTR